MHEHETKIKFQIYKTSPSDWKSIQFDHFWSCFGPYTTGLGNEKK